MYPPIEPYDHGMLAVGDGHRIHWELCGNPDGRPAVALHGGPGSGCTPWWRRLFDPDAHRVVLFDQRGCGRSRPYAGDRVADLSANTTHHLLADIEALRRHLGIERWLVIGGSWGSTLGLAYAQGHPERVTEMVLFSVSPVTRREIARVTGDRARLDAFARRLRDPDPAVHEPAAREWCAWDDAQMRAGTDLPPDPRFDDPAFRLCFARLVTHYWRHDAWLEDGALVRGLPRLSGIPAVLVQGRLDAGAPVDVPRRLALDWDGCEVQVVEGEGHTGGAAMTAAIVAATDRFR
ncbi:MAG TPA: alpha/beta fold hydrolase [Actinomycetospora sp.]|nr:alpha/beta fold hydrolase [Actinomycetospora sp.]